jgi:hypothetical protein
MTEPEIRVFCGRHVIITRSADSIRVSGRLEADPEKPNEFVLFFDGAHGNALPASQSLGIDDFANIEPAA